MAKTVIMAFQVHCGIEDRFLYPTLEGALRPDVPALVAARADHEAMEGVLRAIEAGRFDGKLIETFVAALRMHIEREIHVIFPMAEEWIPEAKLVSICDWQAEHVRERAGRRRSRWPQKWLG